MAVERIAFIGARGHSSYVLRGLETMPQLRVSAIADGAPDCPVEPVARWCSEHGQSPKRYDDWRTMLDDARPQVLVVCGPFDLHATMSIEAMQRGIHVFVEKLAALTFEDFERLRDCHQAYPSVRLGSMMGKRYDPGFNTAHQLIRSGAIGDVRLINTRKSYKLGKREAYYHDRATYGGTIAWVGSHAIDWILWLSGHAIESIFAVQSSACNDNHGTLERAAVCQFTLEGERFATASIDMFRPANAPTHDDDWVRLVGSNGVIEARKESLQLINSENDGSKHVPVCCDRQIFRDFVEEIDGARADRPALVTAAQTLALTEACLLARQAADDGTHVRLPAGRAIGY
jgi:predicted dehydrogenase